MPDGHEPIAVSIVDRVESIPAAEWDACAGGDNPFVSHTFLAALEESGSASRATGWAPHYLTITDAQGRLAGAVNFKSPRSAT